MKTEKKHCYACGNNPVPHFPAKMSSHLAALGAPLSILVKGAWGRSLERTADKLLTGVIILLRVTGLIKFNTDINQKVGDRAKVIWEEANRRNIPMRQVVVGKFYTDGYEAVLNGKRIYFMGLPIPRKLIYQSDAYQWIDDKAQLKKRLLGANVPAPKGGKAVSFAKALKIFNSIRKPVIVKPASGSRGRHTTTFISTPEQLHDAFKLARQITREIVVEEHLTGSVYRGTVVGGRLRGVLRGDPPRVTGDGVKTIAALIEQKNKNLHPRVKPYTITPLTVPYLSRIGYTLKSVLEKDKTIDLTEKIGVSYGGYSAEEFPICHPKTKAILEKAGQVVGFPVMGFDFIIQDITKDPDEQFWGIIECNSVPFIDLHHHPVEGEPINVAQYVWDLWLD
jgi:D-alanine-D-alanine ligase-like ATP-grasp enzyme